MGDAPAIGIDLGTTNSCVAVMRFGKVEVIANEQGNFVTPSYVAFNDYELLVGDAAKKQVDLNPQNTVFDAKRMIGRKFDDPTVQNDMKHWPFLVKNIDSEPRVELTFKGQKKLLAPEEISALVLSKLKETAESYLNEKVKDAVITVPAYFNNGQRQATKDAAEIAGLNVLRILNEPTAAAIAYNFNNHENFIGQPNILVYDLGGGTFDVSIMNGITNSVVASSGDTHLGGGDFDCRLVNFCMQEFKRKHKIDLQGKRRAISRLRNACEVAKRELSSVTNSEIILYALADGVDFSLNITRARFEELNSNDFKKTFGPVQAALDDAKLAKADINIILLVGGSTRIPKVQKLLVEFFNEKQIDKTINPDEAVAYGAAIYAAVLKGNTSNTIFGKVLQDITPLSLGLVVCDNNNVEYNAHIILRNTPIPAIGKYECHKIETSTRTLFSILQGESSKPEENYLLGEFSINDLPNSPAVLVEFDVIFQIDANGILSVTATVKSTGKQNGIVINDVTGHLRKKKIDKMIEEAKQFHLEQRIRKKAIRAKDAFEQECYTIRNVLLENDGNITANEKSSILHKCEEALNWLEENPRENQESYEQRHQEVKTIAQKIIEQFRNLFNAD